MPKCLQKSCETIFQLKIGLMHGKKNESKEAERGRMDEFVCGEINILLMTTVIEVGVNVPKQILWLSKMPNDSGLFTPSA